MEDQVITGSEGATLATSVTWWDAKAAGYRSVWCDNKIRGGCVVMSRLAKWDGKDFILNDEFTRDGKNFVFKEVVSEITVKSFTQTLSQGEAGKDQKTIVTIHATREDTSGN